MHFSLNAVLTEVILKLISSVARHNEEMVKSRLERHYRLDLGRQVFPVDLGKTPSFCQPGVKAVKLYAQYRRLNFVHARGDLTTVP